MSVIKNKKNTRASQLLRMVVIF